MRGSAIAVALAFAVTTACTRAQPGPPSLTPTAEQLAEGWPYGHWVIVTLTGGRTVGGELIAVDYSGRLYLGWGDELSYVSFDRVARVDVVVHRREGARYVGWAWSGFLSTVSHGFVLVFTAPIWLLAGVAPANSYAGQGIERDPRQLHLWARFPQGLPPALADGVRPLEAAR